MYNSYFFDYENESRDILNTYISKMGKEIDQKILPDNPYLAGEFERKAIDFLERKSLSDTVGSFDSVIAEMAQYFSGTTRWYHPYMMNNIKTPVNLLSLAVIHYAMMFDPNLAGDANCGQIAFAELEVIKYISELIGWDWKKSGGYFTFGGTSTLLNGVKIGINKAVAEACRKGVKKDIFIISSEQGHSAHADVCNWLGIGSDNCIRVPVDRNYQMDIGKAEEIIVDKLVEGKKLGTIIACGGTTIQTLVDSINEIYKMRERLYKKFNLSYRPHIHVDSVVGWIWLFYKKYSFAENKMRLSDLVSKKIEKMCQLMSAVEYADSIGVDFHKTGFCPYASSLFITKDREEIYRLNNKEIIPFETVEYGNYSPSTYTLELSRSSTGALSALTVLKLFGYEGFQRLLGDIIEGVCYLVQCLTADFSFEVINPDTNGTCILFIIKPIDCSLKYHDLPRESNQVVKKIALFNYNFYLYVLSKINHREINFFIDYSSGYEKTIDGFQMGVLKMQSFNPMLTKEKAAELATMIINLKEEFESQNDKIVFSPVYQPKKFKLKHLNQSYRLSEGKDV